MAYETITADDRRRIDRMGKREKLEYYKNVKSFVSTILDFLWRAESGQSHPTDEDVAGQRHQLQRARDRIKYLQDMFPDILKEAGLFDGQ